ncbi:MAG: hypothetical protein ACREN5_06985, partial [Gemmatimonadales bacterium]
MPRSPSVLLLASVLLVAGVVPAASQGQFGAQSGFAVENPVLRRMWRVGTDSTRLPQLAQALLDSLGPRLTASPGMEA